MGVSKHELDIGMALVVKDFRGEIVDLTGADPVPIAVKPTTASIAEGKAIAVQVLTWKDSYVKLKGDPINDSPAVPVLSGFDGLFLPAKLANIGERPMVIKLAPTVATIWLMSPQSTSAHVSWFIGA